MAGRFDSAGRQLGQLGANALDALLPGDWLPNDIAKSEDYLSGRELLGGSDDMTGHALGFAADVFSDPLTYLPGGVAAKGIGKAGEIASAGIKSVDKFLPGTEEAIATAGRKTRDFFGQQRADHPELWNALDRIRGSGNNDAYSGLASTKDALGKLDPRQRSIIGDAIDNARFGPDGKPVGELIPSGMDPATGVAFGGIRDRIAAHPDLLPGEADALTEAANKVLEISRNQKARPGIFDAESQANLPDEYLQRQYTGIKQDPLSSLMDESGPGLASALKERKNKDWRDILDTLTKNPDAKYERDALVRMANRSGQHGNLAKRADTGAAIMDLLRQGKMGLPDDLVVQEAVKLRNAAVKPPVPETGSYEDVGRMMGGDAATPAVGDPYGTALGAGKGKVSEQADVSSMLGGSRAAPEMPAGIEDTNAAVQAEQTGKAVVGQSAKQPSLTMADLTPEEIDAATKSLLSKDFALSDPDAVRVVKAAIGKLAETAPETSKMALDALSGQAPRGALMDLLARSNQYFKRFATYGIGLPKAGSLVRNRLNGIFQTLANPATRGQTLQMLKTVPSDLSGAVADAMGLKVGKDAASGTIEAWEGALASSAGSPEKALAQFGATHPEEAAFIKHGGIDGYIRADDLVKEVSRTDRMKKIQSFLDLPGKIARGIEDRMRLQLGKAQIKKYMAEGMSLDEAAKKSVKDTGDALYRYSSNSSANRTLRDIVPYAAWTTNAVPASAKFLAEKPAVASLWANAMAKDPNDDPLYPYLENRVNFDLGKDANGNRQVIGGFGFPEETLTSVPNPSASLGDFGREVEQSVIGQFSPVLKSAYGAVAGHDPMFQTPIGTYDKIPVAGHAGEAGRIYNEIASTGALAPIDAPLRVVDKLADDRRSLPVRLLDSLTGANVVTVDPLQAKAQQIQQELARNPDVSSIAHLTSKDQDAQSLIKDLMDVQRKMKARRKQ
jgi:hypothetical protein